MVLFALAFALHLIPAPESLVQHACAVPLVHPLRVDAAIDPAAFEELNERWKALGIPLAVRAATSDVRISHAQIPAQAYRLKTYADGSIAIGASSLDGVFYAVMTLAQLPQRHGTRWMLPCVDISDAPALQWRILSDDVSRGALPTMRYFEERIRTIAAFKMNGYSPYMESVFIDPRHPLPAPLDGITPAQLRELAAYAQRFHVHFIPDQQTFAHMHNTLAVERYASAADLPHAFLLSPAVPLSLTYIRDVLRDELQVVPHPPFFHIGADETSTLGLGKTAALVASRGRSAVYANHITEMNRTIAPSGARIMLWDDGIQNDPSILQQIPRSAVVVNWHYGVQSTYLPYIHVIAKGGFQQMVAPGANNWNQIYPSIGQALLNEGRFITEGKNANVLGLFEAVWDDDGEALFEATWYPVIYAAASSWERNPVNANRFGADFPAAFFGVNDARYAQDIADLTTVQSRLSPSYEFSSDYFFWADPFDARAASQMQSVDVRALRLQAEDVETHLLSNRPPLHAAAARVMFLAARKYDLIGRKFQAAQEVRDYYAQAQRDAQTKGGASARDLLWCKYWFWELRDRYEELAPLYASAWRYEDRESHLASNLERYHLAAGQNIGRADRFAGVAIDFAEGKPLPPLEQILNP